MQYNHLHHVHIVMQSLIINYFIYALVLESLFQSSVFPSVILLLVAPPSEEEAVCLGWKANEAELIQ